MQGNGCWLLLLVALVPCTVIGSVTKVHVVFMVKQRTIQAWVFES